MRLTADLKTPDKTSYLNDTYCIYRCHYSGLDIPWGRRKQNKYTNRQGAKSAANLFQTKNAQSKKKLIASSIKRVKYISEIRSSSEREGEREAGGKFVLDKNPQKGHARKKKGGNKRHLSLAAHLDAILVFFFFPFSSNSCTTL